MRNQKNKTGHDMGITVYTKENATTGLLETWARVMATGKTQETEEVLLLDNVLTILGEGEREGQTVFLAILGQPSFEVTGEGQERVEAKLKQARVVLLSREDLNGRQQLLKQLRPATMPFQNNFCFEALIKFWWENYLSRAKEVVLLEEYIGRYKNDQLNAWLLHNKVVIQPQKGVTVEVLKGTKVTLKEAFLKNAIEVRHEGTAVFLAGEKWFYIKAAMGAQDITPLSSPVAKRLWDKQELEGLQELIDCWMGQYGNKALNLCVLGWFFANMYMDEVSEGAKSSFFPYFAISGLTQTGKTSLIANYFKFWGMEAKPTDYTQVSMFVEVKQLGSLHGVPLWRDEFREGVGQAKVKGTLLRSLYNQSPLSKGTANQGLKYYEAKSSIFLSGEDWIQDPATLRRAIAFSLYSQYKLTGEEFDEATYNAEHRFWQLFVYGLKFGWNGEVFRELFLKGKEELSKASLNSAKEEAVCYAALGAVLGRGVGEHALKLAVAYWQVIGAASLAMPSESKLESFWRTVKDIAVRKGMFVNNSFPSFTARAKILDYVRPLAGSITQFFIDFSGIISLVHAEQRGDMELTPHSLRQLLNSELKGREARFIFNGVATTGRVITIDESSPQALLDVCYSAQASLKEYIRLEPMDTSIEMQEAQLKAVTENHITYQQVHELQEPSDFADV